MIRILIIVSVVVGAYGLGYQRGVHPSGFLVDQYYEIQIKPPEVAGWLSYDSGPRTIFLTLEAAQVASRKLDGNGWQTRIARHRVLRDFTGRLSQSE